MKIGVFSAVFGDKPWEEACKAIHDFGVTAVEVGCGGFIGKKHLNPQELLKDKTKRQKFKDKADKYGLEISALAAHGNPLHPDEKVAKEHTDDLMAAVELAPLLGVDLVNCFGGCPGADESGTGSGGPPRCG